MCTIRSDESSTVLVGEAPPLEDVLNGSSKEEPFDRASFYEYATTHFFVESINFLSEVRCVC